MEDSPQQSNSRTISNVVLHNMDHTSAKDIFVDVRKKDEWNAGHIEWFKHIPLDKIFDHVEEFKKYERVFLICHSGGRSSMASDSLQSAGVPNTFNIEGGMEEWKELGFPTVGSETAS